MSANHRQGNHPLLATGWLSLGLFGFMLWGRIPRKRIAATCGAIVLAAVVVASTSCGGNSTGSAVHPSNTVSYRVTINGSSSSVQLATTVVVTVQ
jgi:hypothetical protein